MFRRAGVGRVRKDISIPLKPPADRVWVQALDSDAVLVLRRVIGPDHAAFFQLGQLTEGARRTGAGSRLPVMFFEAEDYLPDARWAHMLQLVGEHRAWGALIACTRDG